MFKDKLIGMGADKDGRLLVNKTSKEFHYAKGNEVVDEEAFYSIPFRIFMAGNLSFYAMCLGKASSSTSCYLCDLTAAKWKPAGHDKGVPWMLHHLIERSQQLTAQ